MVDVRRKKLKQSPYRVMRAILIAAAIVTLAVVLYRIDTFQKKKSTKRMGWIRDRASPEQLILHQEQEKLLLGEASLDEDKEEDEAEEEKKGLEQPVDPDEGIPPEPPQHRQFIMTLAGLSGPESRHEVYFETRADWSPIGVEHFHRLVEEAHFYDQCRFFRVVPKFVVQFGIAADPATQERWKHVVLKDDPVKYTNERGTITFATSGPNTRTTQLFINLRDNSPLDRQGFSPIGRVLADGMEWIERINDVYREKPQQGKITQQGNQYLAIEFPELSFVESIRPLDQGDSERRMRNEQ